MLTRHTVALGLVSESLAALSCSFRTRLYQKLTFFLFVLLNLYIVFEPQTPAPDVHVGYLVFTWFAVRIFILTDFHFLATDMQIEFSKKDSSPAALIATAPFLTRLKWGFDLVWSIRGIGWKHGLSPPVRNRPYVTHYALYS